MLNIKTILIVDDDELVRTQLLKELKRNFFNTFIAGNGEEAIGIFNNEDIDIVLLDIKLPDTNGLNILERIKQEKSECEVVVITGYGTREIAIQSLRRGAIDYIEKPIQLDELFAALGRAQEKLAEKKELNYKHTLLVIDDEEEIVKRLKRILVKSGYEVFTASCGKDGLDIINTYKIDVIITDIKMSDMNGIEVLQKAKRLYPDIEGIMVTGFKGQELAIKALRAGAIDYIVKPVNLDALLFSVNKAIERINLNRNRLYRNRELKISSEIISKMNEELEKRIEERSKELSQTQAQLFQTSKLATLGEMSAGLAHEMNQPLGGISLVVKNLQKLIEKDKLDLDELKLGLNDIDASVYRMSKIIKHIRTFARQDTLKFSKLNVNETILSAISLLGEQLRLHDIKVSLDLDDTIPEVTGEPYQLEQVWINLITNARDAVDEKAKKIHNKDIEYETSYHKEIIIKTIYEKATENVIVIVKDNGLGISNEVKEKIFTPFFTTKEVGQAMGLGLAISYGIIESHKGKIEIAGEESLGAEVRVRLYKGE